MNQDYKVVIVHYHLRPGGVTRVIENAEGALERRNVRVAVLVGEAPPAGSAFPGRVRVVEGLGYASGSGAGLGRDLADRLEKAACETLGGDPDIWHFHNHSLGKNPALSLAVHVLAGRGKRLLLQVHDFAEDNRSRNYRLLRGTLGRTERGPLGLFLYPQAPHVHYAVLNSRDQSFLSAGGVDASRLHRLPNAVSTDFASGCEIPETGGQPGRLFLYPTRAIRRKNLGELLLWSALASGGDTFATTLLPLNPAEVPRYDQWVKFAGELDLPVEFGIGGSPATSFLQLAQSAFCLVTTSVAEGFGMAFLEPWILGRPLVGRDLPEITVDFSSLGIDLSRLYNRLEFPLEWIDASELREKIKLGLSVSLKDYGRNLADGDLEVAWRAAVRGDRVDFGRVDEGFQAQVIRLLVEHPALAKEVSPASLTAEGISQSTMAANRTALEAHFSLDSYAGELSKIYETLLASPTGHLEPLDADAVLDEFLSPQRFCLLRT